MDNSISINLEGNNSMDSLKFHWLARFADESLIPQFNSDNTENKFQLIKDKFEDLRYFYLTNNIDKTFCVDLVNGLIFFNNHQKIDLDSLEKKYNIRLIFFRRHKIEINESNTENSHTVKYHLGFQYNRQGINRQITLQIDEEGNFIVDNQ